MSTETSSIDDVLAGAHLPPQPAPIIEQEEAPQEHETEQYESDVSEPEQAEGLQEQKSADANLTETDDYGNDKPKQESKTYTEDEVNERINKAVRERLARLKDTPQPANQEVKKEFEYNPEAEGNWQQQLETFVEQTVSKMTQKQQQQQHQQREQQAQQEFESKFHQSMGKFSDFVQVVGSQPITDAMTLATRAMSDPAAFLYAAAKRHAPELQRIANIPDQYVQMVEIGRLEERMRKSKPVSKAPRPLSQTREDSTIDHPSEPKEPSIEELIARSEALKMKKMKARRG